MSNRLANIAIMKKMSPIWIFPIVTVLIGIWVLYCHVSQQGKSFTLITSDANGIVAGKTIIKSRNVEVGKVVEVTLSNDLKQVIVKGRINRKMSDILRKDAVFWIVKPQIDIEGISGLGTLLSGVYIEVMPGKKEAANSATYPLLDSPPIASLNTEGIRINLVGKDTEVILKGAPVLFHGFRVGNVEKAQFDVTDKEMKYQLFIAKPYDSLITQNIRFWREGGINLNLSSKGASLDVPSLDILMAGSISFDVPIGATFGSSDKQHNVTKIAFHLYPDKESIQDSQYTEFDEFLLLFSESIAGLKAGSPVEYRGVRLGTVAKVPYFSDEMDLTSDHQFTIPVLIRIEPQRLPELDKRINISQLLMDEQKKGLRASIKSSNLFTGSMYIDLDFYPDYVEQKSTLLTKVDGYKTIATSPSVLSQLQTKLFHVLDNFDKLPLKQTIDELHATMTAINKIVSSKDIQVLPKDLRQSLDSLKRTLNSVQPGSEINQSLRADLEKFERVLDKLSPLLKTLNEKSNALIFAAPANADPMPKAKGSKQ